MNKKDYLSVPELKKELKLLDEKELMKIIVESYKESEQVKKLLSIKFNLDEMTENLFLDARKQIIDQFFPDKGFGKLRLGEARKAISSFKKLTSNEERTFQLMLIYVEVGVEFTNTFGDIDERFYASMISMYDNLIETYLKNPSKYKPYKPQLEDIVDNTDGIGWGFHDGLVESFMQIDDFE